MKNSSHATLNSHVYTYNVGNPRTQQVFMAGNYVNYTYDDIGQLWTATGKGSGGSISRLQEQLGYAYDAGGNLNFRTNNGFLYTFKVNALNELTSVTRANNFTENGPARSFYTD